MSILVISAGLFLSLCTYKKHKKITTITVIIYIIILFLLLLKGW
nr:MAG TPA: hypothetical protein [Caudoviricetes sp.]